MTDGVLSRLLDVVWAFPVYLLAISISIVALTNGLDLGVVTLPASSLWMPIGIIAIIYIPYVARPIRGQVLSVREKEYIEAAIAQGASDWRLMLSEILPNVITTVIVFFPLMIATDDADRGGAVVPLDRRAAAGRRAGARSSATARTCCTRGRGWRSRPASRS